MLFLPNVKPSREVIKAEAVVDFSPSEGLADLFTKRFGQVIANVLADSGWLIR